MGITPRLFSASGRAPVHIRHAVGPVHPAHAHPQQRAGAFAHAAVPARRIRSLTGIEVAELVNLMVPADTRLSHDWLMFARNLLNGTSDVERLARTEAFLQPRWDELVPQRLAAQRYTVWVKALALRAATSASGGSVVNWAEVAADTDYADQSHLCRETRRLSGFSPEELRRCIETDEAFWPYRLWR